MAGIMKISEAAVLALHAMIYMANAGGRKVSTHEIAEFHHVSENHLSKVLQRLVHAGYVDSIRGPKGGFEIAKKTADISLLELYELFDGPMQLNGCLFDAPVCGMGNCIFGTLLVQINTLAGIFLTNTRLSDVAGVNAAVHHVTEGETV